MKHYLLLLCICIAAAAFTGCHKKNAGVGFSYDPLGYYYQLLSFEEDNTAYRPNKIAWVTASFKTQSDSVFWDSYNNMNDRFYLENDSSDRNDFFRHYVSRCSVSDSACVLIRTKDFFYQQFKTAGIPFFSKQDSVIRVDFKIKQIYGKDEFVKIQHNLRRQEEEQIEHFFGSPERMEKASDPSGFYWIEKKGAVSEQVARPGDIVTIAYKGYYLNGRFLEKSGTDFEFIYGTPDQLLKGLNYVIGRLKLGENAKIILPSRLAFGENGSSNGTVPPYTPLVYEIQLINLKTNESLHEDPGVH